MELDSFLGGGGRNLFFDTSIGWARSSCGRRRTAWRGERRGEAMGLGLRVEESPSCRFMVFGHK